MFVEEKQWFRDSEAVLTLEHFLYPFEEVGVVESSGEVSSRSLQETEVTIQELDTLDNSCTVEQVSFLKDDVHELIK